jgi:glycerophosphoryl diester phosphodiesterase
LYLEIKPLAVSRLEEHLPSLTDLLSRRNGRLRILSSSAAVLRRVETAIPEGIPSLVIRHPRYEAIPSRWSLSPHHTLVEQLLPTGRELHPWTVNTPRRIRTLATLGVPSLTTDDPERALRVLATWENPGKG